MAKPVRRLSRRAATALIIFALSAIAGLTALEILPVAKITQKISQILPNMAGKISRDVYYGINPGTPVINESILPSTTLESSAVATAAGPLKQSTVNKRYFADPSGKIIYLTGSHTWSNLQDNGGSFPPPAFDYSAYLDFLNTNNHNFFRLWVWEQSRWTVETADDNYWFNPMPYQRVAGHGNALDGQPKFDLTQFNQAYFDRMRSRIIAAGNRGIYVSIMLFNGWSIDKNKGPALNDPWKGHPFNKNNNINGIDGDPNNDGRGSEVHTLAVAAVTAAQKRYVDKVIDTVKDLDNVLYEISNESRRESTAWQYAMINYIHTQESLDGHKKHPVGMTWQYPDGIYADLENSPADWISPKFDPMSNPPEVSADTARVFLPDTDHLCGVCGANVPDFIWKSLTRGHNPIYMDPYDAAQYGVGAYPFDPNGGDFVRARKNLGYARTYAERINLLTAVPSTTLCSTGYCLHNSSTSSPKYLVYAPDGGQFTVNLTNNNTVNFTVEWFNPATGLIEFGGKVTGGSNYNFTSPFNGRTVLYLHLYQDINANHNYLPATPKSQPGFMIPLSPLPPASNPIREQD